jgi:D-beta-D-heptose 7-phosphate kinase/D-beta-D-heptose 1-phosphate adenosyltransferase
MSLCRQGHATAHVPTIIRQAFDVTGAGDTVIAVLTAAIATGASIEEAMWLANAAAGVTVSKIGTASVTIDEIAQQLRKEFTLL